MESTVNKYDSNKPKFDQFESEQLSHYDPSVEFRVSEWFQSARPLVWIPIISRKNFPDTPDFILDSADRHQTELRLPIAKVADLLNLPENVTGWLMPADEDDTDVACTLRDGEVYVLGVQDSRTGKKQTLLGEVA
jgi:hypothetical protein